ncbi:hypothetical protein BA92_02770 [Sanguibacteroides justesenii]|uniref:Uncharacterized protein n=1 Tax=Sanguibacteroides justesenii TaxID=1547597 RepID=A0A0C3NKQ6_9PORP|nr:hypothetical protein BA92_02770 [Sanguibacteroides justesenii]
MKLINCLPTFKITSLIEISSDTNFAQGGSRSKPTKRTKIDCSLLEANAKIGIYLIIHKINAFIGEFIEGVVVVFLTFPLSFESNM